MRHFLSNTYAFVLFHKISQLDKFEGANVEYNSIIFKYELKKKPKPGIFGPKLKGFLICTKLCNKTNLRGLILNVTKVFQSCCAKQPSKVFVVRNFRIFIFE